MEKNTIASARTFDEGRFTKVDIFKSRNSSMFLLNFTAGQTMKSHSHPGKELYLHVLSGKGEFIIDDEKVQVAEDDVIHLEKDEMIGFENGDGNSSIYITMNKIAE
ncbi:cupin domain-containing protein [Lacicoccus qingdaonensis]|uniref:Cupin domain-containing protein n=1 Tax=Lacicoccus qingdaonensis TaxID=576118 RepID=A0A1G9IGX1_9BACL|nr:cupin domain-containing protein [Salinicoccus qingdaonensis]SDL24471.1 Cupin domain-containing protein [Salinicoccus qingdaonensis]